MAKTLDGRLGAALVGTLAPPPRGLGCDLPDRLGMEGNIDGALKSSLAVRVKFDCCVRMLIFGHRLPHFWASFTANFLTPRTRGVNTRCCCAARRCNQVMVAEVEQSVPQRGAEQHRRTRRRIGLESRRGLAMQSQSHRRLTELRPRSLSPDRGLFSFQKCHLARRLLASLSCPLASDASGENSGNPYRTLVSRTFPRPTLWPLRGSKPCLPPLTARSRANISFTGT